MFALKLVEVPEGTPTTLVGKVLKLKSLPATIGRGKDATIVVQHRKLSRLHCRFYLSEEKLHVRDLGSTNGTSVNGNSVVGAELLKIGDLVSAGGVVFQIGRFVTNPELNPAAESPATTSPVIEFQDPQEAKPRTSTTPHILTNRQALEPAAEVFGTDTVDWRPLPTGAPAPELVADASRLEIEPMDPKEGTSQMVPVSAIQSPVSAIESDWIAPAKVTPVSSVQIESSFVAKAGSVDASELPDFAELPRAEIDPNEIDLADVTNMKKDASVTALGNFFSKQNLRRS
jgi:pSer/pThr/pTyr-binding forkhead associated (FHA) protein